MVSLIKALSCLSIMDDKCPYELLKIRELLKVTLSSFLPCSDAMASLLGREGLPNCDRPAQQLLLVSVFSNEMVTTQTQ